MTPVIFTPKRELLQPYLPLVGSSCGNMRVVEISLSLRDAISACRNSPSAHFQPTAHHGLLLKWELFRLHSFDVVLFVDVDIEVMPLAHFDPARAAHMWATGLAAFASDARISLLGRPDHTGVPLNTGLLLARPSKTLFQSGVAALRNCSFNASHGWGLVGPAAARAALLRVGDSQGEDTITASRAVRFGPGRKWDFVCADSDQGFFFWMVGVVDGGLATPRATEGCCPSKHWAGAGKVQTSNLLRPPTFEQRHAINEVLNSPWALRTQSEAVRMYDVVIREEDALLDAAASWQSGQELGECVTSPSPKVRRFL